MLPDHIFNELANQNFLMLFLYNGNIIFNMYLC